MRTSVLAFACLAVPCRPLRRAALMPKTLFARVGGDADKISSAYEEKRHAVPAATSRRILILDPACPAFVHELAAAGYQVTAEYDMPNEDLERVLPEYDGVVVRSANRITRRMLASSPRLAVVGRAGSGVDNIDLTAAAELGVPVVNAPTGNARSVAELVFGLMLGVSRSIPHAHDTMRRGKWAKKNFVGRSLRAKTLGIVGFGAVGQELARMAIAFGMVVLINKQSRKSTAGEQGENNEATSARGALARDVGVTEASLPLDELLSKSDFLSVHVPLTASTEGMIGAPELAMMKPSAVVLNTARGGVVDERALLSALEEGRLGGAAFDVFEKEKAPLEDCVVRLCRLPNVICTPHIGGSTEEAAEHVLREVCGAVVAVLEGSLPPERVVSGNAHESLRLARLRLGLPPPATP